MAAWHETRFVNSCTPFKACWIPRPLGAYLCGVLTNEQSFETIIHSDCTFDAVSVLDCVAVRGFVRYVSAVV